MPSYFDGFGLGSNLTGAALGASGAINPLLPLGAGLLQGLGSGIMGGSQNDLQRDQLRQQQQQFLADLAERRRQYDNTYGLNQRQVRLGEMGEAQGLGRTLETLPLRDRAIYAMAARLGMSPGQFQPRDMFNAGTGRPVSQGGIDLNALQRQVSQYQPGAGGTNPGMYQAMLRQLGYSQGGAVPQTTPSPTPTQPPTPAQPRTVGIAAGAALAKQRAARDKRIMQGGY